MSNLDQQDLNRGSQALDQESIKNLIKLNQEASLFYDQKRHLEALANLSLAISGHETALLQTLDNYRACLKETDGKNVLNKSWPKKVIFRDLLGKEFFTVPILKTSDLSKVFGFKEVFFEPNSDENKHPKEWKMELDDSPIFRYLFRNLKPRRHLEFGTWQGYGTNLVAEECSATIWTINGPFGEESENGHSAYGHDTDEKTKTGIYSWAEKVGFSDHKTNPNHFYRTDGLGFIGRFYVQNGHGNRVCQIYSNSIDWDTSQYPEGFFDSALVDGGHQFDVVKNDTIKAINLVREGGVVIWHDFCPSIDYSSSLDVVHYITKDRDFINENFSDLFWIYPSFILVGVRGKNSENKKFLEKINFATEEKITLITKKEESVQALRAEGTEDKPLNNQTSEKKLWINWLKSLLKIGL